MSPLPAARLVAPRRRPGSSGPGPPPPPAGSTPSRKKPSETLRLCQDLIDRPATRQHPDRPPQRRAVLLLEIDPQAPVDGGRQVLRFDRVLEGQFAGGVALSVDPSPLDPSP